MQDLFAAQFAIRPEDPPACFSAVAAEACNWAWRGEGRGPDPQEDPEGSRAAPNGYEMRWRTFAAAERADRAVEVVLLHPDEHNPARRWRTVVEVCGADREVRLSVRVAREATRLLLAPARVEVRRPSLVKTILSGYPCSAGAIPLSASPGVVHVDGVRTFFSDVLTHPERVLPVVLAAPAGGSRFPVDPRVLANELAGLAHTYVLGGHFAWERLREISGGSMAVPRGGVRLYWPGYGRDDDTLSHRYWTAGRIASDPERIDRVIALMLARISVHAIPLDPLPRELQRAATEEAMRQAAEGRDSQELLELLERENLDLRSEVDALRNENQELSRDVTDLSRDLEAQRASWASIGMPEQDEEDAQEADSGAVLRPTTWPEFVEALEAVESPAFVVTDRAREMCDPSSYPDPERMWWHIERLAEAAEAWAMAGAAVGDRLDDWVRSNYEIEIALHDNALGDRAAFVFEGLEYSKEPHVKVDDYVDPASCGRIYFAYDAERLRFIVDHIGLHL